MNKPDLYNRTVDILVQAYFDDTLLHKDCSACAVGNMIAANMGCEVEVFKDEFMASASWRRRKDEKTINSQWELVFCTGSASKQTVLPYYYSGKSKEQIDSTGYTWQELAKIEYAFEMAPKGSSDDEWMFNGLMAVIEVLDKIHGNENPTISQASKKRFSKELNVHASVATDDASNSTADNQ